MRAENGPPIAGTKEPVIGVPPVATWMEESSQARVLSWTASSSSSSLRVGARYKNTMDTLKFRSFFLSFFFFLFFLGGGGRGLPLKKIVS